MPSKTKQVYSCRNFSHALSVSNSSLCCFTLTCCQTPPGQGPRRPRVAGRFRPISARGAAAARSFRTVLPRRALHRRVRKLLRLKVRRVHTCCAHCVFFQAWTTVYITLCRLFKITPLKK